MTLEYQHELFWHYPLLVEFDHRHALVEEWFRTFGHSLCDMSGEQQMERLFGAAEIYPLRLWHDRRVTEVEKGRQIQGTGEQVYYHTAYIPFLGDEQLWLFNPGVEEGFPLGEVFRRDLIIAVATCDEGSAERQIGERIARVEELIAAQDKRIGEFHQTLPQYIEARLANRAGRPGLVRH